MQPINLREYEEMAQTRMDQAAWDYFQGGSDDEITAPKIKGGHSQSPYALSPTPGRPQGYTCLPDRVPLP